MRGEPGTEDAAFPTSSVNCALTSFTHSVSRCLEPSKAPSVASIFRPVSVGWMKHTASCPHPSHGKGDLEGWGLALRRGNKGKGRFPDFLSSLGLIWFPLVSSSGSHPGVTLALREQWAVSGDISDRWGKGELLASRGPRPGILLPILQGAGRPATKPESQQRCGLDTPVQREHLEMSVDELEFIFATWLTGASQKNQR